MFCYLFFCVLQGFILTIFSWLISLFVVLPLFWLISRTHDFHNFLSHTSKARATRSATMSHIGPQNLSCAPNQLSPYTESNSREASKSQHGNASVELSVEQQKPKAGSHKIASSDMGGFSCFFVCGVLYVLRFLLFSDRRAVSHLSPCHIK